MSSKLLIQHTFPSSEHQPTERQALIAPNLPSFNEGSKLRPNDKTQLAQDTTAHNESWTSYQKPFIRMTFWLTLGKAPASATGSYMAFSKSPFLCPASRRGK